MPQAGRKRQGRQDGRRGEEWKKSMNGTQTSADERRRARRREYLREWRERNREKIREYARQWYWDNHEHCLEVRRRFHDGNKEAEAMYNQRYYEENRETVRKTQRAYYERNRERILEKAREKKEAAGGTSGGVTRGRRRRRGAVVDLRCEVNLECRTNQAIWWMSPANGHGPGFEIISEPQPPGARACCAACKAAVVEEVRRMSLWGAV